MKALIFCLALLFLVHPALADEGKLNDTFILEINVEGRDQKTVSLVNKRGDALWMDAGDLNAAGISIAPDEMDAQRQVNLSKLSGMQVTLRHDEQKLLIMPEPRRLLKQVFDLRPDGKASSIDAGYGFIGQYDITATVDDINHTMGSSGTGTALTGTYFTPSGNVTLGGFAETNSRATRYVRLDTMYRLDDPENMRRFLIGDTISGGPSWARSLRFAGFQMATDFSLRPDLATMPLPDFFGQSTVPATVDVFVNSAKVFETQVESGPFEINNLPVLTGSGQARVVVRDVLGRETIARLPFFATESLLRKNLRAYDLNIGFVRGSYGQRSFNYGKPIASGSYRYGLTDSITVNAHLEAAGDAQVAGGGASFAISSLGIMHVAGAFSNRTGDGVHSNGALTYASFESQLHPVNLFGSVTATVGDYADIARYDAGKQAMLQMQLGGNVDFGEYGSLSTSWVNVNRAGGRTAQFASLSYKLSYNEHWNFLVTSFYDVGNDTTVSEAVVTYVFDDGAVGTSSISHGERANQKRISYSKSPNGDGGFGYGVSTSLGDMQLGEAQAMWLGRDVHLNGSLATRDGMQAARINAAGGIVAIDDAVYMTKPPKGDAVALVKTGQPDASVYLENREVGKTDAEGEILVTGLVPYIPNKLSINPADYKMSAILDDSEKEIRPLRQSGVMVDFTPPKYRPVIIVLQLEDKTYAPAGAKAVLDNGSDPLVVGRRGEIFIRDLTKAIKGTVSYGECTCTFAVELTPRRQYEMIERIGPLSCTRSATL